MSQNKPLDHVGDIVGTGQAQSMHAAIARQIARQQELHHQVNVALDEFKQRKYRDEPADDCAKDLGESYEDHPLFPVLIAAIQQAMYGKGERHGGARTPFMEQPWRHYSQMHGRGFLTGQAAKKLEEAASTREGKAFEQEVLGAIVYCGMALIYEREKQQKHQ